MNINMEEWIAYKKKRAAEIENSRGTNTITVDKTLFRSLAKYCLGQIEMHLDNNLENPKNVPLKTWEKHLEIAKGVLKVMDDEYTFPPLDPESPIYEEFYRQWEELRDLSNTLVHDINYILEGLYHEMYKQEEDE
jgi:hypothetical protein